MHEGRQHTRIGRLRVEHRRSKTADDSFGVLLRDRDGDMRCVDWRVSSRLLCGSAVPPAGCACLLALAPALRLARPPGAVGRGGAGSADGAREDELGSPLLPRFALPLADLFPH